MEQNKALLIVSFGTSYNEARTNDIEPMEADLAAAFPDRKAYTAWTSKFILKKLLERDNTKINNVSEAMEQMLFDGITDVLVQPTHILDGIENNRMKDDILSYKEKFSSIKIGRPLLCEEKDYEDAVKVIADEFPNVCSDKDKVLVLMGHGTDHKVNTVYDTLDKTFKDLGHSNIFIGTVEAEPAIHNLVKDVCDYDPKEVIIAPFLNVAGDHARNDMAGTEPDSWVSQFKAAGYKVSPVIKGLGSYPGIRKLYIKHAMEITD